MVSRRPRPRPVSFLQTGSAEVFSDLVRGRRAGPDASITRCMFVRDIGPGGGADEAAVGVPGMRVKDRLVFTTHPT